MELLLSKLNRNLERLVEEFPGVMGIAVKDIVSGEEILINENEIFPIASSVKIPILIEFFKKAEAGLIDPDEKFIFTREHKVIGSGILLQLEGPITMSYLDYATLMITVSDNAATNICIDLVGMEDVNKTLIQLGLEKTKLQRKMMDREAAASGKENISTPHEMMKLMDCLYNNTGISPTVCEKTLGILKKLKQGVIRAPLPDNIDVADKSGGIEGVMCDIGIVYIPKRPYIVAVHTKHIPKKDPKKIDASPRILKVTNIIYEYFQEKALTTQYGRRFEWFDRDWHQESKQKN